MAFTFNLNCYDGFGSYCQDFRDVAAVFHIEPEHNPRAGKPSLTWFALTRKGGQLILLQQCNCQLAVYRTASGRLPTIDEANAQASISPAVSRHSWSGYHISQSRNLRAEVEWHTESRESFKPFALTYEVTVQPGNSAVKAPLISNRRHSM